MSEVREIVNDVREGGRLSTDLSGAHEWLAVHLEEVEKALYYCLQDELLKRKKIVAEGLVVSERRPFDLSWDIHANPLCQVWTDPNTPASLRDKAKEYMVTINRGGNELKRVSHVCFKFGRYILDPTFGQFVNLDASIKKYPHMFIGRNLLASKDEIARVFGVVYTENGRPSIGKQEKPRH